MNGNQPTYSVGQVAGVSGVSTRTLRHYDHIGLLVPSYRTDAGYRRYTYADCERLRNILVLRELGIPLADMDQLLPGNSDSEFSVAFLRHHLGQLRDRQSDLARVVDTVERALAATERGEIMGANEMFNGFEKDPYEDEARERWGETDAYKESTRRVKTYGAEDWARYETEAAAVNAAFLDCMARGLTPDGEEAKAAAEQHRLLIDRWFYPTSHQMHAGLGAMYVADPRFTQNIDKAGEGLAAFMSASIAANAADHGSGQ